MEVRAIVFVGALPEPHHGSNGVSAPETIGGVPLALMDVLGRSVLDRVLDRLARAGVSSISVLADVPATALPFARSATSRSASWTTSSSLAIWRTAEERFSEMAQEGAELVLVLRLGGYAQVDPEELIQFHLSGRNRVTSVMDAQGPLDLFLLSTSHRNDAAYLFRHQLQATRMPAGQFVFRGYANRLRNACDLRRLALDGFSDLAQIAPVGEEVKPGVWLGRAARIHPRARILAPAFIGLRAKVHSGAVVTRGSVLEHHSEVDFGTVVEDSSVLPYSYLGAGLDVTHSVVGFRRLAQVARNVEIEISDAKLLAMKSMYAHMRTISMAASLAAYLPKQLVRGFFASSHRDHPTAFPESSATPEPSLQAQASRGSASPQAGSGRFPANFGDCEEIWRPVDP